MFWTLELASYLEDAPWPATKDELIDYAIRSGAPIEVVENLQELEDEGEIYEGIEDIWPDYPSQDDFFFNEDEYWRLHFSYHNNRPGLRRGGFLFSRLGCAEAPNNKRQEPNKKRNPKHKCVLDFVFCNLFGSCFLLFGIYFGSYLLLFVI